MRAMMLYTKWIVTSESELKIKEFTWQDNASSVEQSACMHDAWSPWMLSLRRSVLPGAARLVKILSESGSMN